MKVEVDVLDSPSLLVCKVSVDVKQHLKKKKKKKKKKWRRRRRKRRSRRRRVVGRDVAG